MSTTTRSRPTASRSAISTGASCIVEQFGLATIPGCPSRSSGLTWDTTSGTVVSIRQADELSMTVAPWATAAGASSREMSAPAENSAMSTPSKASATASPISSVRPSIDTVRPADRPEASRRSSPTGNSRSLRIWIIVRPTTPVAPTTATVRGRRFMKGLAPLALSLGRARPEYSSGPFRTGCKRVCRTRNETSRRSPGGSPRLRGEDPDQTGSLARWRCMAALRERLTRPWRSTSRTTTMISSPTDTTSSTVGTW